MQRVVMAVWASLPLSSQLGFYFSKSLSYLSKIEGGFECGRVIDESGARKMIGDDLLRCTTAVIEKLMERHKNNTSCKNSGARILAFFIIFIHENLPKILK